jgi:cholesterol transport system auxiliary component
VFLNIGDDTMTPLTMTRRIALLGATSALSGCGALSVLNTAAAPLDTYDLSPAAGSKAGSRSASKLLIARPEASAALATDRIMVRSDGATITYLPDARWPDAAPLVLQSLLVRSIAATGRIGYVGNSEGGPVPDTALLVRMDAFEVVIEPGGTVRATVDIALTALDDRIQRVLGSRSFAQAVTAADDSPRAITAAFQAALDIVLPSAADWVLRII